MVSRLYFLIFFCSQNNFFYFINSMFYKAKCSVLYVFLIVALVTFFTMTFLHLLSASQLKQSSVSKSISDADEHFMIRSLNETLFLMNKDLSKTLQNLRNVQQNTLTTSETTHIKRSFEESLAKIASPVSVSDLTKVQSAPRRAVLFTMDSIGSYEKNSLQGGAAGELIVRHSLEFAFKNFGIMMKIVHSDEEFNSLTDLSVFDFVLLDPWTWAAKGWVAKRNLVGHEHKIYILDFFGSEHGLRGNNLKIPLKRFLTAFGSPWNSFLGYHIPNTTVLQPPPALVKTSNEVYGVVWGKDVKHFVGRERILRSVADSTLLYSTATSQAFQHRNVKWLGHQSAAEWKSLLSSAKFLIGLGNPLLGPSAIDAIAAGCVFINPVYTVPMIGGHFKSQHPYAAERIGMPYVCSFREDNTEELLQCVEHAKSVDLPPFIPADFEVEAYLGRVRELFAQ